MYVPENPLPTFADWRDRAVYLIAEFKWPISATILGLALYLTFAQPSTPDPPEGAMGLFGSLVLLSIPSFMVGKKIAEWFLQLRMWNVQVSNGGDPPKYHSTRVPPAIWDEKTVEGAAPLDARNMDGWADFVVTDFEWLEDVEELRVRGSERTNLNPGEREASEAKVEAVYSHYVAVLKSFSKLKARVQELVQLGHDDAMLQSIKVRDKTLAPTVSADDVIEHATAEESDELPKLNEQLEEIDIPDLPEYEEPEQTDPGGGPGAE